jgi:long-chain acyl-CoA synthetase
VDQDLSNATLGDVLRATAARLPDQPALLSEQGDWTWSALDREVDRVAARLREAGVVPGQVVGFMINKRAEVVIGFLAVARVGAIVAPVNFKLQSEQLVDQFATAHIRAVLVQHEFDDLLFHLLPFLADRRRVIYVGGPGRHEAHLWEGEAATVAPDAVRVGPDDPCYYNYTSGTTGRPKGAVTTHRQILANAVSTINSLGFRDEDVFLGMFSVFAHPHELFHRSLLTGGAFAILDSLSPRVIAQAVERYRVSWMMAVPSFYEMMLDYVAPRSSGARAPHLADVSSLRVLESGGAYVSAETLARMEVAFGCQFLPVWGCTEASGVALANGPGERSPGATGRLVEGYELRIVGLDGQDLPAGEVGELLVRGPAVVTSYVNAPEESKRHFVDGWYHTSDLVRLDAQGFVHFAGRRSEMLKIGGIRVYPLEIEVVLKEHPEVVDAVVVRSEDRLRGEIARAVIATVAGSSLSSRDVQAWCRDRLAGYKVPRLIEFWTAVPKLPNGKIDKGAVLAVAADPDRDDRKSR